mgnify:CR=1 FL=1
MRGWRRAGSQERAPRVSRRGRKGPTPSPTVVDRDARSCSGVTLSTLGPGCARVALRREDGDTTSLNTMSIKVYN